MHKFIRLSPHCFPPKVWKRTSSDAGGYAQYAPDERDILRREAIAAWQLGFCSFSEATAALRQIERLEANFDEARRETLSSLAPRALA